MTKANSEIRTAMQNNKIPAWAIGAEIGVHENTVLRRLRFELSEKEKKVFVYYRQAFSRKDIICYSVRCNVQSIHKNNALTTAIVKTLREL